MAKIKIYSPVLDFSGIVVGISFQNGEGEVESDNASALAYFDRKGYARSLDELVVPEIEEIKTNSEDPDESWTNNALREYITANKEVLGEFPGNLNAASKAQLLEFVLVDEEDADDDEGAGE